jgi:hypothetical protein
MSPAVCKSDNVRPSAVADQFDFWASATTTPKRTALDNLTLRIHHCFNCGNDTAFIGQGDGYDWRYWLRCRNCKSCQKYLSHNAVQFLIVCDTAITSGTSIETIRAACSDARGKVTGPLAVALDILGGDESS